MLDEPSEIFLLHFARLTDNKNRRLTALRRASQFKGVLKKRLIRWLDDTLKIIEDSVFKLDNDFDLLHRFDERAHPGGPAASSSPENSSRPSWTPCRRT
ncbi:MAG: hypothetical protein Q9Q13_14270 [Acidobacteriota bacterium]|nr:hypothetical protein [Acidobacteriota bacterium]